MKPWQLALEEWCKDRHGLTLPFLTWIDCECRDIKPDWSEGVRVLKEIIEHGAVCFRCNNVQAFVFSDLRRLVDSHGLYHPMGRLFIFKQHFKISNNQDYSILNLVSSYECDLESGNVSRSYASYLSSKTPTWGAPDKNDIALMELVKKQYREKKDED